MLARSYLKMGRLKHRGERIYLKSENLERNEAALSYHKPLYLQIL